MPTPTPTVTVKPTPTMTSKPQLLKKENPIWTITPRKNRKLVEADNSTSTWQDDNEPV